MTVPPVQLAGSPWQSAWTGFTAKTVPASPFSVGVGDLIVVMQVDENSNITTTNPTITGTATVTWTNRINISNPGNGTGLKAWTAVVSGAGTFSAVCTVSTGNFGVLVAGYAAADHGGVGRIANASTVNPTTGNPSATPTGGAWSANSTVWCADGDWSAGVITGRSFRTNIGAATELNAVQVDGNYSTYAWVHADSGSSPASGAIGMSAPTQIYSVGGIEVLGTAGALPVGNRLKRWQY